MHEKIFMTFVTKEHFLERNIKSWLDSNKYKEVDKILKYHIKIRHLRGGESTKLKFINQHK